MKVLLRQDISGVGRRGDIVSVSSGHARNFLLPRGLAIAATDGAVVQATSMRRARDLREAADRESAQAIVAELAKRTIQVQAKAGSEGRLFGSVTASDIAQAVSAQAGITLDRKSIEIASPIRTVGDHNVTVELFAGITGTISLSVSAS
ncbi:MAG: 50S ribosomal protein L9 [Acidimicrobiia bacterium]|jgi:large subunit ribosomal protein L9|nr:50S ribosomal protein L9 [Actinomycetota bacterium]NDE59951.1 50S ribosomal protein L9 [Acidimicrobiia bacterium]NBY12629.1 50S ribosomal protein L9 [Actinomycetota bacterium]NCZ92934.1 50S ribosomal protein L9 [Actinomycetota bacterium]NDC27116.1 50S ribosomal protein L9 [Actinomycetota bacterium]